MANIRKEAGRHHWRYQKVGIRGRSHTKEMWLCMNCSISHDEEKFGTPPSTGCIFEVKMANLGKSRMDDLEEDLYRKIGTYSPEFLHKKG